MTDFCFWRAYHWHVVTKVVVAGYLCDDPEYASSGEALIPSWSKPATLKPNTVGQVFEFAGPKWTFCGDEVQSTSISFDFIDHSPKLSSSLKEYISIDQATSIIKVVVPAVAFQLYNQQTLQVAIKAKMLSSPYAEYYAASFDLYFDSLEIALCSAAAFSSPTKAPTGLSVQVF